MADAGVKTEHQASEEVSFDDDEVALVGAATEPAVDDHHPAQELDRVLATGPGGKSEAQMNGAMVLALLDKIIGVVDQIQHTQNGLEARQEAMEKSVSTIQGELTKLSKNHVGTANTVNKMLDKVRKVSVNVKTVRSNLEKQAGQIKKLESNENELLKRRNFKVLIYQKSKRDHQREDWLFVNGCQHHAAGAPTGGKEGTAEPEPEPEPEPGPEPGPGLSGADHAAVK